MPQTWCCLYYNYFHKDTAGSNVADDVLAAAVLKIVLLMFKSVKRRMLRQLLQYDWPNCISEWVIANPLFGPRMAWVFWRLITFKKYIWISSRLQKIFYSPWGYWTGLATVKNLAVSAKVSENSWEWLSKQAICQIYLPTQRHIPRPKFGMSASNEVHQADLLYPPYDKVKTKTHKYALTVVNVASHYTDPEILTMKDRGCRCLQKDIQTEPVSLA